MTRYFYEDGQLVKSITTPEHEWDEDQQALMIALYMLEKQTCPGCGGDLNETMKVENEFEYMVTGPYLCWGCQAMGRARDRFTETHPHAHFPDRWVLKKR